MHSKKQGEVFIQIELAMPMNEVMPWVFVGVRRVSVIAGHVGPGDLLPKLLTGLPVKANGTHGFGGGVDEIP